MGEHIFSITTSEVNQIATVIFSVHVNFVSK